LEQLPVLSFPLDLKPVKVPPESVAVHGADSVQVPFMPPETDPENVVVTGVAALLTSHVPVKENVNPPVVSSSVPDTSKVPNTGGQAARPGSLAPPGTVLMVPVIAPVQGSLASVAVPVSV
jgi:hypothetical protein